MAKEACFVVLDVGTSMARVRNDGVTTGLDMAKEAFRLMLQQKLLFGYKQDQMGVVLFNTDETNNFLADANGGYNGIDMRYSLQTPNLDLLEAIDGFSEENGSADVLDAILVAAQSIINFCGTRKYRKRIFVLTDGANEINDTEQMPDIASAFVNNNIEFNCIGIGFGEIADDDDSDDDDNDGDGDAEMKSNSEKAMVIVGGDANRTEQSVGNEKIIREFAAQISGGAVYSCKNAISMISEMRSRGVLQRATFNGAIKITSELAINCQVYSRCREQTLPSLKKQSALVDDDDEGAGKVKMDRVYKNKFKQGEDDEVVDEEERVRSYLYGKQRIPFTDADLDQINFQSGEKHFQLLAFISNEQIKRQEYMGPACIVVPKPEDDNAAIALSAFIHACDEKHMSAIARFVARKNASPKLVVLQPRIKASMECLIMNELPFFEDRREYPFASFKLKKEFQPSRKQLDTATKLVESLDLMTAARDEDGDECEALRPQNTYNPILQRYYDNVQTRALDPQCDIQPLSPLVAKYLEPAPELFTNAAPHIKAFAEAFPTKLIPKKEAKAQRQGWSEFSSEVENLLGAVADAMKAEEKNDDDADGDDDDLGLNINDMLAGDVVKSIGTQAPIDDFNALLKEDRRTTADHFTKLCSEFWAIIYKIIEESFQSISYGKAIDCIQTMRDRCIVEEEALDFNKEVRSFRNKYETKNPKLWQLLAQKQLTLLCIDDFESPDAVEGLTVTAEEATKFLEEKPEEKPQIHETILEDSDDDLELV